MEDKIAEIKLNIDKAKAFKKALLEVDFVACALVSNDGKILRASPKLCDYLGTTQEQLVNHHFTDITHPDYIEKDVHLYKLLSSGEIDHYVMNKKYLNFITNEYFDARLCVVKINGSMALGLLEKI